MFSLVSGECMGDGEYIQIFWEPGCFPELWVDKTKEHLWMMEQYTFLFETAA